MGLRTLCFAYKKLSNEEFEAFKSKFDENFQKGLSHENDELVVALE